MAGSAICRALLQAGYVLITATRSELDLEDGLAVQHWFAEHRPTVVVLAAAKVGGIHANNSYPADFLLDNLKIKSVIESTAPECVVCCSWKQPFTKFAEQPIRRRLF